MELHPPPTHLNDNVVTFQAFTHRTREQEDRFRRERYIHKGPARSLVGCVVGLVGYGRLARRLERAFHELGCKVVTADPYVDPAEAMIEVVPLHDLLAASDIVVLACPLNDETRGMIGADELALMRPSSYLMNPARGALTDEAALAAALRDKAIAGAAVDAYSDEPNVEHNPLFEAPNALLTPHIGGHTHETYLEESLVAVEAVSDVAQGHIPRNLVNRDVLSVAAKLRAAGAGTPESN